MSPADVLAESTLSRSALYRLLASGTLRARRLTPRRWEIDRATWEAFRRSRLFSPTAAAARPDPIRIWKDTVTAVLH